MTNWMIELYYIILFSLSTGTLAYLIWNVLKFCMEKTKRLRYIYPMLVSVLAFYLLPCFYLWIRMAYLIRKQEMVVGELLLWTPSIVYWRVGAAVVWLLGMAFCTVKRIIGIYKVNRSLRNDVFPAEDAIVEWKDRIAEELHLKTKIDIYRNFAIFSPMVTGVWRKRVLLPDREYNSKELEAILYHELVHIRQGVVNIKFFIGLLQIIHWFNPIAYLFMKSMDEWGETACDLAVNFDTKCSLTFKEYFKVVLRGLEDEQVRMPDSATQFQKKKGVVDRVKMIKGYEREKDFKLAGGILAIMLFIALSTSTALAAGTGIEQAHASIFATTKTEEVMSLVEDDEVTEDIYIEYEESLNINEEDVIEIPFIQRGSDSFSFGDTVVPAGKIAHTSLFRVEADGKIVVTVSVNPDDVSVKVGIIKPNGSMVCVRGNDVVTYTFKAEKAGDYRVYIDNDSDTEVTASGYVAY